MSSSAVQQPLSAPASAASVSPVPEQRLDVLDVLRGIALLGMFVVHFSDYATEAAQSSPDAALAGRQIVETIVPLFFGGRFFTMFALLFGVGFALQLGRADARGERFTARFVRRLAALAVFGAIAEGIFGYNVLLSYALWGLPLLLVRRWPVRALVVLAILCAASRPLYNVARFATLGREQFIAANQANQASFRAAIARYETGSQARDWRTVVAARFGYMPAFYAQFNKLPWGSFTLFLLGLIGFRLGLFDHPERHRRMIMALMAAGAASWAFSHWVLPIGGPLAQRPPEGTSTFDLALGIARANAFMLVRDAWLAFTYIGAVLLLVAHDPAWLRRLAPLGGAGRMALTNYMAQVIVLDTLFTPHGLGLTVTPLMVPLCALALFAAQAAFSRWWLARYRFGPLEWVWRSVTYWKLQPQRVDVPARGVAAAVSIG
jgi:uncharacterized protein